MRRVVLVVSSLEPGGAERVVSTMASHWGAKGWAVTLLTFDDGGRPPFYTLDARVHHVPLALARLSPNPLVGGWRNAVRIRALRREIRTRRPDAVIAFTSTTGVVVLLATRGLRVPVLVAEHTDPFLEDLGVAWRTLRNLAYRWATQIVVLNERARGYFGARFSRVSLIPNPVVAPSGTGGPRVGSLVLSMGRLIQSKRYDLLLLAFARIATDFPAWRLLILGEGPLRPELEALRDDLGLAGRVELPGVLRDPHELLRRADLFVLSSGQEVFPMALCEALACGVPVIATAYHDGVREIVRDDVDGVIVPRGDEKALAAAMAALMTDASARRRLGARGPEIVERYGVNRVMTMWETLLARVAWPTGQ